MSHSEVSGSFKIPIKKRVEIKHISVPGRQMRPMVREMEAFGWRLDDHEDEERGRLKMRFLRPENFSEIAGLRKLELAFSRLPRERSLLTLRIGTAIVISFLIGMAIGTSLKSPLYAVLVFILLFSILMGYLNLEGQKLKRRKEIILSTARRKTRAGRAVGVTSMVSSDEGVEDEGDHPESV